ncbi:hypothetical protein [Actinomycetospora cinnamomea]|uniref:Uncharacterized protein n=1 Tax=Actinomycetospora cinnamomea TaxID=663609 RepID=A0A2U1FPV8_9PSEU|nr:hypothetical protein [Actinomycetospora cinnamomea]PVZ14142.1 hypothetical protein C8D89_1012 [Actinomycetospora cinnamomea]
MEPDQNEQLVLAMRNAGRRLAEPRSIRDLEQTLGQIVAEVGPQRRTPTVWGQ